MLRTPAWAATWSVLRAVMAALIIAAVVAQLAKSVGRAVENGSDVLTIWTNFFSFFTILSNILACVVLLWAAAWFWLRRRSDAREPGSLAVALACVSTYMIITGIVYNALLRGITLPQGSEPIPWSNEILHLVGPLFLLADVLVGPLRRALPWKAIWVIIAFPLVWVGYTMLRGPLITNPADGSPFWYPYPFLNPNNAGGWGSVIVYVIGIAIAIIAVGGFVIWWGRRTAEHEPARPVAP